MAPPFDRNHQHGHRALFNATLGCFFATLLLPSTFTLAQDQPLKINSVITEALLRDRCASFVDSNPVFTSLHGSNISRNGDIPQVFRSVKQTPKICERPTRISAPLPSDWIENQPSPVTFYFFQRESRNCAGREIFYDNTPFMKIDAYINEAHKLTLKITKLIESPPPSLQMVPEPMFSDTIRIQKSLISNAISGKKRSDQDDLEIRKAYLPWVKFEKFALHEITDSHQQFLLWVGQKYED
ncbi:MAG: hypothetical protein IPK50_15395 [Fibrobacterota bacterium]|nr:hypothetical protein [Fibrobacterota bacterium]QQS03677.1 MAG: hypothetical protein IPK50_15395 [Fibrobacterota bacterium]